VRISSERELLDELDAAASALADLEGDWSRRVAAMARLEGLVRGNAPDLLGRQAALLQAIDGTLQQRLGDSAMEACDHRGHADVAHIQGLGGRGGIGTGHGA
jgi:hypothetical protein